MKICSGTLLVLLPLIISAQIPLESWRDHLPYQTGKNIAAGDNQIFCATDNALFSLQTETNEIARYSKVNGLSDVEIADIAWHDGSSTLLIAYKNANLDLMQGDAFINMSDIRRSSIIGNKTINKIIIYNNLAYLACGFGIVVTDVFKKEIRETYLIKPLDAPNVLDLAVFNDTLYAATDEGLFRAPYNGANLADFSNWERDLNFLTTDTLTEIETFGQYLILNKASSVFSMDSIYVYDGQVWQRWNRENSNTFSITVSDDKLILTENYNVDTYDKNLQLAGRLYGYQNIAPRAALMVNDELWVADENNGLVMSWDYFNTVFYNPGGPFSNNVRTVSGSASTVFVVPGAVNTAWGNTYTQPAVYRFKDEIWESFHLLNTPEFTGHHDLVTVAANPQNPENMAAGSWGTGLLLMNGDSITWFDHTNSPLGGPDPPRIAGLAYDHDGNLWVMSSFESHPLNILKTDSTWIALPLPGVSSEIGQTVYTSRGQLWMILARGRGLAAYDPGESLESPADDKTVTLNSNFGQGGLPTNDVFAIAEDHDGEIWVGTNKGIVVFYAPESVFTSSITDAQPIKITQDNTTLLLLESETVTAIAVDGANRKWLGTSNGGVFLMSEDGTEQVYHFTTENSPLLSNTINSIHINQLNGEVFFGTDKGLISFKSTATEGGETFNNVYAWPNPVRPEYRGPVAIKGLISDAEVRITDVAGNLVYSTKALGGQAVWNGRRLDGNEVSAGVYLVFCTNTDGSQTIVTKILIVR